MPKKIKILFLASDPRDVGYRPNLDEEFRQIRKSLASSRMRKYFELVCELAVQPSDLKEALTRHEPAIVHFSGHGNSRGLLFQDQAGRKALVSKSMLAALLKTSSGIRILCLNACYTKSQLGALSEIIDFTIGMNNMVWDSHAIAFAASFYRELASESSVNNAFESAIAELGMIKIPKPKTPEMKAAMLEMKPTMPELKIREGADASSPFFVRPPARPRTQKPRRPASPPTTSNKIQLYGKAKRNVLVIGDNARVNSPKPKR